MQRLGISSLVVIGLGVSLVLSQSESTQRENSDVEQWHAIGALQPRISPNGKVVAFSYQGAIWRMPLDVASAGSVTARRSGTAAEPPIPAPQAATMTRLTDAEGFDVEPAWSGNGKLLAYINSRNMSQGELRVIKARDGSRVELPKPISAVGKLYFHPDNRRILGNLRVSAGRQGLAWYDTQSGATQYLTGASARTRFALSNDGEWLVFATTMETPGNQSGNDGPQADIWKLSTDAANTAEPVKVVRFPSRIHDLCWAHDDQSLIIVSELGGVFYDLWTIPFADPMASAIQLTFGQADEYRPSMSNDGRRLLYSNNSGNCTSLVVRELASGLDRTLVVDRMDYRMPTGRLRLRTVDQNSRQTVSARVSIEQLNGKYYAPIGALHRVLKNYGHFYCDQHSELRLPAGKYRLRALRGPEYRTTYKSFEIAPNESLQLDVELQRWIHCAERGWFSGENHIHANYGYGEWFNTPRTMLEQCSGENLNVCNFMVANSDTDGVYDRRFFRGRPDPLSTDETILYWNQEFRATIWGHMTLVNLQQVVEPIFTGFKDTTNPWDVPTNSDIADKAHRQNGLVNYTHVAQRPDDPYQNPYTGKGIPIDVALGKIDSLDLNASYVGTVPLWYRLLNCGFHLTASAGTDCFLNRVVSRLPGGDRVYVKIDGLLNYKAWIKGLREGRSFVTNGPMLEFSVNEHVIGDTVRLSKPATLTVSAKAMSQFPLNRVEVVYNGQVAASGTLSERALESVIQHEIKIDRSGWLAFRASGPGHLDHPLGSQYAHTSPIYIEVADQPAASSTDAEFFLKWIDRLALALRVRDRFPDEQRKRHVQTQLEAARKVYLQIAERL